MKFPIVVNEKISFGDLIFKYILRDFFLGLLKPFPSAIGVGLRMIFWRLAFKKCGTGLRMAEYVTIKFPENITIGDHVSFNEYGWIDGNGQIEMGSYISVGPGVAMVSFDHNHGDVNSYTKLQGKTLKKIVIEDNVWIGAHVTIRAGVKIGSGAIIGAGSVVLSDVEPNTISAGVPAQKIKDRK